MKSNAYNAHGSHARTIVSENTFAKGMKYTNNPLTEGYVKTLINYQLSNDGATIKPRLGYTQVADNIATYTIDEASQDFCVYFTENLLVSTADESDAILCRSVLSGAIDVLDTYTQAVNYALQLFSLANANITIAYKGRYITGINEVVEHFVAKGTDDKYYLAMQNCSTSIHECNLTIAHSRNGVHTVMDSCVYVPVIHTYINGAGTLCTERHLATVHMRFNETLDAFTWWLDLLEPKNITAVQAVNYGYNMLQSNPYTFVNQETANSVVLLDGILPYDSKGSLITSARTGAEIFFHLVYRYPKSDLTNGKKYRVRWAIQDLDSDAEPVVIQDYLTGDEYTPGDDVFVRTTQTTYKRFTLIANVCYADEIVENEEVKPLATITLAYYYLTDDHNTSMLNVDAVTYDLSTAQGMCTWQQRLVLWGVSGAKNTLWVSEINDPSWFPYPNNCEIFPDDIVACVRYKTHLLVFTCSALYQLTLQADGLSYTTTCMQERLTMNETDISSIIPVQNMVFFKNGNAYFMIVPVSTSTAGELQLAPISRPIELMFTDFKTVVIKLLENLIKPTSFNYYVVDQDNARLMDEEFHLLYLKQLSDETVVFEVYDWWCMLENRTIRIYYKFKLCVGTKVTYLDTIFNYDTSTRAWTMSLVNSTRYRVSHYISSVTAETIFTQPTLSAKDTISVNLIQGSEATAIDEFDIDYDQTGWNESFQYLDTGFRDLNTDIKKRFRQVQFRVNNLYSDTLKFYTSFAVDNDVRKHYCTFETTEIVDPDAEDYGSVYVDAVLENPDLAWGMDEYRDYITEWELDMSRFPNADTAQVRFNVSGKGNLCRFELRSYNRKLYEISSVAWVYRPMYAR